MTMALVYVDRRSTDVVTLPRDVALRAAETVQAIAAETVPELERLHSLAWQAGSAALIDGLDRLIGRLSGAGRDMHDFAGIASAACPDDITAPGHGKAA
jgi:hypothetical protein